MSEGLDRNRIEPLYVQLAAILRAAISDGTYAIRLPSEPDLAVRYGTSRETVRAARDLLVAEGWLRVSRGRGVFITPPGERETPG